jgi:hypothetical protein
MVKKYRCYLFDEGFPTISSKVIESKDDDEAARTCKTIFASSPCNRVELWDGARRLALWWRILGARDRT